MIEYVMFDLSEVLISGLVGIEEALPQELFGPKGETLPCFGGPLLDELLLGSISEDTYLQAIIERERWETDVSRLKRVIRDNFHNQVEGMPEMLEALAPDHNLVLLSDHAKEWIAYIRLIHPFLRRFSRALFSFELGRLKRDPGTYTHVLQALSVPARDCLFIGDNPVNVAVAQLVGLGGVCFVNAEQLASELRGLAIL